MAIIVNNLNGSKVEVSEDDNGNTVINITSNDCSVIKRLADDLKRPDSEVSKSMRKAFALNRRA